MVREKREGSDLTAFAILGAVWRGPSLISAGASGDDAAGQAESIGQTVGRRAVYFLTAAWRYGSVMTRRVWRKGDSVRKVASLGILSNG